MDYVYSYLLQVNYYYHIFWYPNSNPNYRMLALSVNCFLSCASHTCCNTRNDDVSSQPSSNLKFSLWIASMTVIGGKVLLSHLRIPIIKLKYQGGRVLSVDYLSSYALEVRRYDHDFQIWQCKMYPYKSHILDKLYTRIVWGFQFSSMDHAIVVPVFGGEVSGYHARPPT